MLETITRFVHKSPHQEDSCLILDSSDTYEDPYLGQSVYRLSIGEESAVCKVDFTHVATRDESKPINQESVWLTIPMIRQFARQLWHSAFCCYQSEGNKRARLERAERDKAKLSGKRIKKDLKLKTFKDHTGYMAEKLIEEIAELDEKIIAQTELIEKISAQREDLPQVGGNIHVMSADEYGTTAYYLYMPDSAKERFFATGEDPLNDEICEEDAKEIPHEAKDIFSLSICKGRKWQQWNEKEQRLMNLQTMHYESSQPLYIGSSQEFRDMAENINNWCNVVEGREVEIYNFN